MSGLNMSDGWDPVEIPVVFFNGVEQINMGKVPSSPDYLQLESDVSKMISFFRNEITIYLVKKPYSLEAPKLAAASELRRDEFMSLCLEDDIIILVVLNISRMAKTAFDFPLPFNLNLQNHLPEETNRASLFSPVYTVATIATTSGIRPQFQGGRVSISLPQPIGTGARPVISYHKSMEDPEVRAWLERRFNPPKANPCHLKKVKF